MWWRRGSICQLTTELLHWTLKEEIQRLEKRKDKKKKTLLDLISVSALAASHASSFDEVLRCSFFCCGLSTCRVSARWMCELVVARSAQTNRQRSKLFQLRKVTRVLMSGGENRMINMLMTHHCICHWKKKHITASLRWRWNHITRLTSRLRSRLSCLLRIFEACLIFPLKPGKSVSQISAAEIEVMETEPTPSHGENRFIHRSILERKTDITCIILTGHTCSCVFLYMNSKRNTCCVSVQGLRPLKDSAFAVFEGESFGETLLTTSAVVKCDGLDFGAFPGCVTRCFTLTSPFLPPRPAKVTIYATRCRHFLSFFLLFLACKECGDMWGSEGS